MIRAWTTLATAVVILIPTSVEASASTPPTERGQGFVESTTLDLIDDDIIIEEVEVNFEILEVNATSSVASDADTEVALTLDTATSFAEVVIESEILEIDDSFYGLDLHEVTDELIWFTATDKSTGESVEYKSTEATVSAVPLVVAIPALSSILGSLAIATGVVVVLAGITYIVADKAIPAIRNKFRAPQHYQALLRGKLYIGSGLSITEARNHFRKGLNTWSTSKIGAREVALRARDGRTPVGPERSQGAGKYCHYHGFNRIPANAHAFYGTAGTFKC